MAAVPEPDYAGPPETGPAPPTLRPVPAPAPAEPDQAPAEETAAEAPEQEAPAPGRWARAAAGLRPPDVWSTPAPTLRDEVARALEGSHLPSNAVLRWAEAARTLVSALLSAGLLLLVHANRSAGRQAVVALAAAAVWLCWAVLT